MDFLNFEFSESSGVRGQLRLVKSLLLLLPRTPHLVYGPNNGRKGRTNVNKRKHPGGRGIEKCNFPVISFGFPSLLPAIAGRYIEVRDLIPYGDMWLPRCEGDVGWDTGGEFFRCRTIYPPPREN